MNEEETDSPGNGECFADLFETYSAGMNENLQVGDRIRAKVIAIGTHSVFFNTGTKIDGVAEKAELLDDEGRLDLAEGDELDLYVITVDESEIRLSKAISGIGGLNLLQDAWERNIPVEGKVVAVIKGGFEVTVVKRRAFCPISQMDLAYIKDPDVYVGQSLPFLIKRFEKRGKNIVLSRRDILQKELEASREAFLQELEEGRVFEGTVVRIMPFGAFVSLAPGVEGLVHISELSWSRLETPEQAVVVGDRLKVKLVGIKSGEQPGTQKLSLSVKQAVGNPWDEAASNVRVGEVLQGKVTRCTHFGAFVELYPGIEGLVHISEMSYTRRVLRPEEVVSAGDEVTVLVKAFEPDRQRISLSIKEAEGDPWARIDETFKPGSVVQGKVEKKEGFGIFVNLAPGITGLLPKSKIVASDQAAAIQALKPGATLTVTVTSVDRGERRISLETGESSENEGWQAFAAETSGSLGSLGEKLKKALARQQKKGG